MDHDIKGTSIPKILQSYRDRQEVEKYAHLATLNEILENDYNLNIPRYVDTFEEEESVDIETTKRTIAEIEKELAEVKAQMAAYLEELGL